MAILFLLSQVALKALGFELKKAEVLRILRDYDRENTGKIGVEDFTEVGWYLAASMIYVNATCSKRAPAKFIKKAVPFKVLGLCPNLFCDFNHLLATTITCSCQILPYLKFLPTNGLGQYFCEVILTVFIKPKAFRISLYKYR